VKKEPKASKKETVKSESQPSEDGRRLTRSKATEPSKKTWFCGSKREAAPKPSPKQQKKEEKKQPA